MPDATTLAGLLLLLGPVLGAIPVANPSLIRVWSAPRDEHLAIVGAHRVAWAWLNAGFAAATITTTAGLAILALPPTEDPRLRPWLLVGVAAYAFGGALWCAVLAVRARVTPALADLVGAGRQTEPGETLLSAAQGGLFAAFVLVTAVSLVVVGAALAGAAPPLLVAAFVLVGAGAGVVQVTTGDLVPAVLYLPTLLFGAALLAGWT